ncbi:MAG: hypothetical protein AAB290_01215 [Candidatus Eisenbacteria bacterium]
MSQSLQRRFAAFVLSFTLIASGGQPRQGRPRGVGLEGALSHRHGR